MFSLIFIRRPILATVCSIVILLAGAVSIYTLPIAQFPELVPPQVTVSAQYPGATPEVIAQVVASPLETQINGVDDMIYMNSVSNGQGNMVLTVTFELGTDPDQATINVNNRVQMATPSIPAEVRQYGIVVSKSSPNLLLIFTLLSPDGTYDTVYMNNYALLNVVDSLKRIPGVSDVKIYTNQDYAMRIWLKPDKMSRLGITPSDVAAAVQDQNSQYALGRFGDAPTDADLQKTYIMTTKGRLTTEKEFEEIIISTTAAGETIYLRDIARVELGAKSYSFTGTQNDIPTVPVGITLAPGANAIQVCDEVKAQLAEAQKKFPRGITYDIPYDTTTFVRVSIEEVIITLLEALVLVFLVVFLFLQDFRATIIPCLAVPVSIIGTFAGLKAFGFSINTLTLFAMVLAIGLVVDDAIVVIENVDRHMENGLSPYDATCKAMEEVTAPVIAIVLVLTSVFIPIAFLGGLTGQLYKQFAITLSTSVVISGFVALSLTPALCAKILKPSNHKPKFVFFRWFNSFFDRLTSGFSSSVKVMLRHSVIVLMVFLLFVLATAKMALQLPSSLVPDEDQGIIMASMFLPDGSSMNQTKELTTKVSGIAQTLPEVETALIFTGYNIMNSSNQSNYGAGFLKLKDWKLREKAGEDSFSVARKVMGKSWSIPAGQVYAFNPPAIIGMSTTGGVEGYIQSRLTTDVLEIDRVLHEFIEEADKRPEISSVTTTFSTAVPQFYVYIDRVKVKSLGVNLSDVFGAMGSIYSNYYVNDFDKMGRTFQVLISSESDYRDRPDGIKYTYIRSENGDMIPLESLIELRPITGPETMERFNVFPSAKITGQPASGYTTGQVISALEEVASKLSEGFTLAWTGTAYQEKQTGAATMIAFVLGIVMVFLILAAQYEKWSLPFAVVLSVPFAIFGAFLANTLRGLSNDLYFQVALVTLVGLSAKNAILIVEFALEEYQRGLSLTQAAVNASHLRFRPIIMTSIAFILGVLPMAISTGAGAASRHSIGTGIIGGMTSSTVIGIFFVPCFFMMVMKLSSKKKKTAAENGSTEGEAK
ncbi:MAG: multidrug efflux RND transporter permease subunit [Synergistaceae bacterium]|nr:multidrug efflux RND transporter permease subunit [Synergistaceae bacterium]